MILWTFKLIRSVRKAIAGREHPGQLAWGVALGALLGMIPHGNLLAVVLVLFVLMLQVNHAMVALVAVAVTFLAPHLDPTFDALGRWCFAQPEIADRLALAWQYPLVPWTDLNNTIVMGSFLIGLMSVGPLFLVSFPLFRAWAPVEESPVEAACADAIVDTPVVQENVGNAAQPHATSPVTDVAATQPLNRFDAGHNHLDAGHNHLDGGHTYLDGGPVQSNENGTESDCQTNQTPTRTSFVSAPVTPRTSETASAAIDLLQSSATQDRMSRENSRTPLVAGEARSTPRPSAPPRTPRTTRIAMGGAAARPVMTTQAMIASRNAHPSPAVDSPGSFANDQHKIDEALSYLLRQLRDSKDKDAA